jgi:hypothetical protein
MDKPKTIYKWKSRGLKLREGESYDNIFEKVKNTTHCELCNDEFNTDEKKRRCMDHCHDTGFFRMVLCNECNSQFGKNHNKRKLHTNNKSGHKHISMDGDKYVFSIQRNKKTHKKRFKTLEEALEYKSNYLSECQNEILLS